MKRIAKPITSDSSVFRVDHFLFLRFKYATKYNNSIQKPILKRVYCVKRKTPPQSLLIRLSLLALPYVLSLTALQCNHMSAIISVLLSELAAFLCFNRRFMSALNFSFPVDRMNSLRAAAFRRRRRRPTAAVRAMFYRTPGSQDEGSCGVGGGTDGKRDGSWIEFDSAGRRRPHIVDAASFIVQSPGTVAYISCG